LKILLLLNLVSTLSMVGLIWFVQIVHYPMFRDVGREGFILYMRNHQRLTTWVVAPLMLTEALSAVGLIYWPPPSISLLWLWGAMGLVVINWLSTAFLQVPRHGLLAAEGFSERIHHGLVLTNWLRTTCWTLRGFVVSGIAWQLIPG
jgi:hypothetical protein